MSIKTFEDLVTELEGSPFPSIIALVTSTKNYFRDSIYVIKVLVNSLQLSGIYITVNRPYESLVETLRRNGINTEKLFFIDCITKTVKGKPEVTENCLFIASPQNLTELGIALTQAMEMMKESGNKFLLFDSLTTLLIYNQTESVAKFSHFLTTSIRLSRLKGIFLLVEKREEELLPTISQFFDKIIKLEIGELGEV